MMLLEWEYLLVILKAQLENKMLTDYGGSTASPKDGSQETEGPEESKDHVSSCRRTSRPWRSWVEGRSRFLCPYWFGVFENNLMTCKRKQSLESVAKSMKNLCRWLRKYENKVILMYSFQHVQGIRDSFLPGLYAASRRCGREGCGGIYLELLLALLF